MQLSPKESGLSVAIAMPAISTAFPSSRWRRTKSSLATTAAAAPSEVGQHWSRVSGSCTAGDRWTCSSVNASRNWEFGFSTEWRWFFTATRAKLSGRVP